MEILTDGNLLVSASQSPSSDSQAKEGSGHIIPSQINFHKFLYVILNRSQENKAREIIDKR
jgi:hypothetical protein